MTETERVLEVRNLSVEYQDSTLFGKRTTFKALDNVSFHLNKGEILGLAGLVGAGRTEIVRALFGADKILSGKVVVKGKEVKIKVPADAQNAGLSLVPEDRKQQGVLLNGIADAGFTQLTTELGVVCHADTLVVHENTSDSALQLLGQSLNLSLLLLQDLLTRHKFSPPINFACDWNATAEANKNASPE